MSLEVGVLNATSIKAGEGSTSGAVMLDVPVLPAEASATLTGLTSQRAGQLAFGVTKGSMGLYYSLVDDGKFHAVSDIPYLKIVVDLGTPLVVTTGTYTEVEVESDEWTGHLARYDDSAGEILFPRNLGDSIAVFGQATWEGSATGIRQVGVMANGNPIVFSSVLPPDGNAFTQSYSAIISHPFTLTSDGTEFQLPYAYQSSGGDLDLTAFTMTIVGGVFGPVSNPIYNSSSLTADEVREYWPDLS